MQTIFFPKQLCDDIDKSSRSFIWGEDGHNRRIHALAWETLCKPKDGGCLGLREARKVNLSFMMKNCWALCSQPNKLWVQVVQSKYVCGEDIISVIHKKPTSNLWRGICEVWDKVVHNIAWNIGNGKSTKFWSDRCLPSNKILSEVAIQTVPMEIQSRKVANFVDANEN
uniref:Ribonuclease H protein At1g65750 family n=1 Tax=Cajanus cajan TaxID=3821 RepID=A0A151RWQ4_CAJCA|nr:Putative ribonuclease H protein At1g65750 family [Cajanus cajan]